jgi:type VI secretion system protein ImpB
MSRSPSNPPKERVNIVYRSGADTAAQDIELPLKMLVMGDFTQQADATPVGERHPVRVDNENFNAVMSACHLALDISVPPAARGGVENDQHLPVHLDIRTLKDLEPEQICRQVEPLNRLMELRRALVALKGPLGNVPAFRKRLQTLVADPITRAALAQELGLIEPSSAKALTPGNASNDAE